MIRDSFLLVFFHSLLLIFFYSFLHVFCLFFSKTNSKLKYDSDLSIMDTRQPTGKLIGSNLNFHKGVGGSQTGRGPHLRTSVFMGGGLTPHGKIDYFKRCGLSPTSTAVSSGERGDGLQVLVV